MPSKFSDILAVAISSKAEAWFTKEIPFYCHTEGWKPYTRTIMKDGKEQLAITRERIEYLANRRNKAVENALLEYPSSKHILMIDSAYVAQVEAVTRLIEDYLACNVPLIMGATSWVVHKKTIRRSIAYYDYWSTIEARFIPFEFDPETDGLVTYFERPLPKLMPVRSVGGCYIFPRSLWDKGVRYGVPDDLHGCEHNFLCERSGLPVYLDFNARLWREPSVYPLTKRIRVSLGARTRIRKLVSALKPSF